MDRRQFTKAVLAAQSAASLAQTAQVRSLKPISAWRVLFNDDATNNFFGAIYPLKKRDLENQVDFLVEKGVDAYAWCTAMPDICYYDSKVGEPIWSSTRRAKVTQARRWYLMENLRRLSESGDEPIAVLANRCHHRGIPFIASVRMNDSHHSEYRFASNAANFFLDHPRWAIRDPKGKVVGGMDYAVPEVRAHRLAILREQVERFDIDGLELDFTRWPPLFRPDQATANTAVMTSFIGEVRGILKRKHLILGMRIPATLEECRMNGLDVSGLMELGVVDYVCPSDFLRPDFNIPVETFVDAGRKSGCRVFPSIHSFVSKGYSATLKLRQYRALANNYYGGGANGISTFNMMPGFIQNDDYMQARGNVEFGLLAELHEPVKLKSKPREYIFYPIGESRHGKPIDRRAVFDRMKDVGRRKTIPFRVMEDFNNKNWKYTLRFIAAGVTPEDKLEFYLNGKPIDGALKSITRPGGRAEYFLLMGLTPLTATRDYEMHLNGQWANRGDNELAVILTSVNEGLKSWTVDYLGPKETLEVEPIVILELKVQVQAF